MRRSLFAAAAAAALAACSTIGRPIPWDEVARMQPGRTTATHAQAVLGPPVKIEVSPHGETVLTWWHSHANLFTSDTQSLALAFAKDGTLVTVPPAPLR